jgi:HlyD family secretion protein
MKFLKNKWLIAAFMVVLIMVLRWACKPDATQKVAIEKTTTANIIETVDETGKLHPTVEMKVSVDPGAKLVKLYVQDGDTVVQGQAIALVETISTSFSSAKTTTGIPTMQPGTPPNPMAIMEALQKAQQPAAQPTLKTSAKQTYIYAPMTGIVSDLNAKEGERILSADLAKVNAVNDWEIRATVGEVDVLKLKEGQQTTILLDALQNKPITGILYRIANAQNAASAMGLQQAMGAADVTQFRVFVKVDKSSLEELYKTNGAITLRTGMNATIKIQTNEKKQVLAVPIKAVTTRYKDDTTTTANDKAKAETVVFVYSNGKVAQKKVSIGIQDMNKIEIISGLKQSDEVVVEPYEAIEKTLKDNMKVKVTPAADVFKKQ